MAYHNQGVETSDKENLSKVDLLYAGGLGGDAKLSLEENANQKMLNDIFNVLKKEKQKPLNLVFYI